MGGRKKIPHIIEDGVEKKLCSRCKQYKELGEYMPKKDRADGLSNECYICISIRNKRRHDPSFVMPEHIKTRAEAEEYLKLLRYKKQRDVKIENINFKEEGDD